MENKLAIYMIIIVGIVALVGLIAIFTTSASSNAPLQNPGQDNTQANALTGNVVYDNNVPALNAFGQIFFVLFLLGIFAYMYFRKE